VSAGGATVANGQLHSALIEGCNPHEIAATRPMTQLEKGSDVDASSLRPPSQQDTGKEPEAEKAQHRRPKRGGSQVMIEGHVLAQAYYNPVAAAAT
jgi:hypothetical protein